MAQASVCNTWDNGKSGGAGLSSATIPPTSALCRWAAWFSGAQRRGKFCRTGTVGTLFSNNSKKNFLPCLWQSHLGFNQAADLVHSSCFYCLLPCVTSALCWHRLPWCFTGRPSRKEGVEHPQQCSEDTSACKRTRDEKHKHRDSCMGSHRAPPGGELQSSDSRARGEATPPAPHTPGAAPGRSSRPRARVFPSSTSDSFLF